jgi:DNA end-binding protein Ku
MRSMWRGAISFGLVMIPVKLYAATEQKDIAFRQVHRADGGRIRFRRVCSIDGEEVPYEDVAKGYELATGEMVVLTDEDMAELPLPSTRSIEVLHFMPAEQLDPILLNRSYYAEPEPAGERAYVLLRDSLERSGKVALAMVALRQRESLATLRADDGVLVVETLLWPDEVRTPDFAFLDNDVEARPQELQMASSLIDSMTADFDPDAYHDSYREALQELVDAKVAGREVAQLPTPVAQAEPTSLADALKASLAAARQAPAQSAGGMVTARSRPGIEGGRAGASRRDSGEESASGGGRTRARRASAGDEAASGGGRTRARQASAGPESAPRASRARTKASGADEGDQGVAASSRRTRTRASGADEGGGEGTAKTKRTRSGSGETGEGPTRTRRTSSKNGEGTARTGRARRAG